MVDFTRRVTGWGAAVVLVAALAALVVRVPESDPVAVRVDAGDLREEPSATPRTIPVPADDLDSGARRQLALRDEVTSAVDASPTPSEAQEAAPSSTPRPSTEATSAPPSARTPVVPDPGPSTPTPTLTPQLGHVPVHVEAVPSQYHLYAGESLRVDVSACNEGDMVATFYSEQPVALGWSAHDVERSGRLSFSNWTDDWEPGDLVAHMIDVGTCLRETVVVDPAAVGFPPDLYGFGAGPNGYQLDRDGMELHNTAGASFVFAVHDGPRPVDGGLTAEPVYDPWPDPPWTATLTPRQDRVAVGDPLVMDVEICNTHAESALNLIVHPELGLPAHVDIRLQHLGIVAQGARIAPPEGGRGSPPPVTETVGIAPGACRTWTAVWNGIEGLVVNGQTEGPAAEPGPWEVRMTVYPPLPVEVFTRALGGDRATIELVAG